MEKDIVENFFSFQLKRKITGLYKSFFFILEDLNSEGIKIPEEEADKMSYHDFLDTDGCHLGDYREPTDKEWEEDRAQAIADNREYAC